MNSLFAPTHLHFVATAIAVLPLLAMQIRGLWEDPAQRYFPLAWLAVAFYVYRIPKVGFAYSANRRLAGISFGITAAVTAFFAAVFVSPTLGQLALILSFFGWILVYAGIVPWTRLTAISSLLLMTWPLPLGLGGRLHDWLDALIIRTVSHTLDLIDIPHLANTEYFDLKTKRLVLEDIAGGIDSPFILLFFAVVLVIIFRRSLLHGLASLACVPVVYWLAQSSYLLVQIWLLEQNASEYFIAGWPLLVMRAATLVIECLLIWLGSLAVSYLLDPVPVDSAEQASKGFQGAYNRLCLWPMNVIVDSHGEDQSYFDEDLSDVKNKGLRNLPRFRLTEEADDPWTTSKYFKPVLGVAMTTFVLATISWFLPNPESRTAQTTPWPQERIETALSTSPFNDTAVLLDAKIDESDMGTTKLVWAADFGEETGELTVSPAQPRFASLWRRFRSEGYVLTTPAQRLEASVAAEERWPYFQVELVDAIGTPLYYWTTSVGSDGRPYVPQTTITAYILRRLRTSVPGRLLGLQEGPPQLAQIELILDAKRILSERSKRDFARRFVRASQQLAMQSTTPASKPPNN